MIPAFKLAMEMTVLHDRKYQSNLKQGQTGKYIHFANMG
jgi:hypothetical protein